MSSYQFVLVTDHAGNLKPERMGKTIVNPVILSNRSLYAEYTDRHGRYFRSSFVLNCHLVDDDTIAVITLNSIYYLRRITTQDNGVEEQ